MKKKLFYFIILIIIVVDIIITSTKGLNVNLYYGEGDIITFIQDSMDVSGIKEVCNEVFGKDNFIVQKIEFFNDSYSIKTKEATNDNLTDLCDKLNEKYSTELTFDTFIVNHVANTRIREIVKPYIIPTLMSIILILVIYAVMFKGYKQMIILINNTVIVQVILYSIYAICRVKVNILSMPVAFSIFIFTTLFTTIYLLKNNSRKE